MDERTDDENKYRQEWMRMQRDGNELFAAGNEQQVRLAEQSRVDMATRFQAGMATELLARNDGFMGAISRLQRDEDSAANAKEMISNAVKAARMIYEEAARAR